jgi:hypothetical protein
MRSLALVLPLALAGCGAPIAPAKVAPAAHAAPIESAPPPAGWRARAADPTCQAELSAFAAGRLGGFRGLERCGRVDAEAALGSSGDAPSRFEQFGEYRVYPHPHGGVLVWFLADDVRLVERTYPKLDPPLDRQLGAPEAKAPSKLSTDWEQWIYASRGISAHVDRASGEVAALFAFRPTTVEGFLRTDVAHAAKGEAPVEELK